MKQVIQIPGGSQLRIELAKVGGATVVDVREWSVRAGGGKFTPTKAGVQIPMDALLPTLEALLTFTQEVQSRGLLFEGGPSGQLADILGDREAGPVQGEVGR